MYSELLPSLKQDPRFKGIERTHSTDSDGKWIIITTKASKEAAIVIIDSLIAKSSAPNTNPNKRPGRSTKYNINSTLVSYAAMLQKNLEPTDITKKNPPLGVQTRNFQISYDLTSNTDFPSSNKKKSKPSPPDKNNDSNGDQASELSIVDTNTDKFQSMMEINNYYCSIAVG